MTPCGIELDPKKWAGLRHIYDSAERIPGFLRQLAGAPIGPDNEAWQALQGLLCDYGYGPVDTASYAAVPHPGGGGGGQTSGGARLFHIAGRVD